MNLSESSPNYLRLVTRWSLDLNSALLQGSQRVRQFQLEQIDAALARTEKLSKQLAETSTPDQQVATVAKLSSEQLQLTLGYWAGLYNTLGQNHIELMASMQSRAQELSKQAAEGTPPVFPEPVASTMRLVAEMARTALSATPVMTTGSSDSKSADYRTGTSPGTGKASSKSREEKCDGG